MIEISPGTRVIIYFLRHSTDRAYLPDEAGRDIKIRDNCEVLRSLKRERVRERERGRETGEGVQNGRKLPGLLARQSNK